MKSLWSYSIGPRHSPKCGECSVEHPALPHPHGCHTSATTRYRAGEEAFELASQRWTFERRVENRFPATNFGQSQQLPFRYNQRGSGEFLRHSGKSLSEQTGVPPPPDDVSGPDGATPVCVSPGTAVIFDTPHTSHLTHLTPTPHASHPPPLTHHTLHIYHILILHINYYRMSKNYKAHMCTDRKIFNYYFYYGRRYLDSSCHVCHVFPLLLA